MHGIKGRQCLLEQGFNPSLQRFGLRATAQPRFRQIKEKTAFLICRPGQSQGLAQIPAQGRLFREWLVPGRQGFTNSCQKGQVRLARCLNIRGCFPTRQEAAGPAPDRRIHRDSRFQQIPDNPRLLGQTFPFRHRFPRCRVLPLPLPVAKPGSRLRLLGGSHQWTQTD